MGAPRQPRRDRSGNRQPQRDEGIVRLYGVHAVEAALNNPHRKIGRLLVTENAENRLSAVLAQRQVAPERVLPRALDRILGHDTVHQGVMLETEPLDEPALENVAQRADTNGPLIVLDHVTDPHNVGAVLRSGAVFGVAGLVMTRRHSPPLDGALAKSASGALEHVPIALVQNLARTLNDIKGLNFVILGLDETGGLIDDEPLTGRIAVVLGAEGKGLRELTRNSCDRLCRIATPGPISSLNVSNAAAIALHLAAARRRQS